MEILTAARVEHRLGSQEPVRTMKAVLWRQNPVCEAPL